MSDADDEVALRAAAIRAAGGIPMFRVTCAPDGSVHCAVEDWSRNWKRSQRKIPGWDCRNGNCVNPSCTTRTHGIHNEEWVYILTSADKATVGTLTVNSRDYPATVAPDPRSPEAKDLTLHVAFNYRDKNLDLHQATRSACCWLDNRPGNCEKTSYLDAGPVWAAGNKTFFEQGEEFWQAFEKWFARVDAEVRDGRSEMQTGTCPHCCGAGQVNQLAALAEVLGVVGFAGQLTPASLLGFFLGHAP